MAELLVIRHGQASFGAENYDVLSEVGLEQSRLAGAALREAGWVPDRLVTGTLERQKQTLAGMGFAEAPEEHPGFNEYDFHDLLRVRFRDQVPEAVKGGETIRISFKLTPEELGRLTQWFDPLGLGIATRPVAPLLAAALRAEVTAICKAG